METTRRQFLVGSAAAMPALLEGIVEAAPREPIAREHVPDITYNNLIPEFDRGQAFSRGDLISMDGRRAGNINGVPQYRLLFKTGAVSVQELYIGPSRYAVSVLTGRDETSFTLVDDRGDGKFRIKVPVGTNVLVPLWVHKNYGSTGRPTH